MKVSVSFLKSKYDLKDTLNKIDATTADYIHVDIMDGDFVSNKTMEMDELIPYLTDVDKPLDVHLMVSDPLPYIEKLKSLNVSFLTIHVELNKDIRNIINIIHDNGINAGLALNPETKTDTLIPYLSDIEYVLIMGVNPGSGGQELIPSSIDKINELISLRNTYNSFYQISLDGGVNSETKKRLEGLDIVVSGSYICMSDDYEKHIGLLK